jgi:polysaccharide deacetylase family protein (PEP-CTERM system associated)
VSLPLITPLRTRGRAPRVLTIDAEDWFHVCGDGYYSDPRRWDGFASRIETTLMELFDRLARGGHRATVFFLGWIARRRPALVKEARRRGHEVGVHGDLHVRADEMAPSEFREDLRQACRSIEAAGGGDAFSVYRAAEWSIRDPGAAALPELASAGFRCDASMMPVPPLGSDAIPKGPHRIERDGWSIVELPPLTGRVLGQRLPMGGAWPFRVLPSGRLARAEARARDRGAPAVFTLHPWELDSEHPRMDGLPAMLRAVHFAGLRGFPGRFERWLEGDRCVAIGDVLPELVPA